MLTQYFIALGYNVSILGIELSHSCANKAKDLVRRYKLYNQINIVEQDFMSYNPLPHERFFFTYTSAAVSPILYLKLFTISYTIKSKWAFIATRDYSSKRFRDESIPLPKNCQEIFIKANLTNSNELRPIYKFYIDYFDHSLVNTLSRLGRTKLIEEFKRKVKKERIYDQIFSYWQRNHSIRVTIQQILDSHDVYLLNYSWTVFSVDSIDISSRVIPLSLRNEILRHFLVQYVTTNKIPDVIFPDLEAVAVPDADDNLITYDHLFNEFEKIKRNLNVDNDDGHLPTARLPTLPTTRSSPTTISSPASSSSSSPSSSPSGSSS